MMSVSYAIESRRTCRAFLNKPVPEEVIKEILTKAIRSPSGGNLQPWQVHVVTGNTLEHICNEVKELSLDDTFNFTEGAEYNVYPPHLKEPYRTRRFRIGEALYHSVGISREDKSARLKWFTENNFDFFGARTGFFFTMDKIMQEGQWADLGMFMQSIMLLAREHGLDTAPQEAWAPFAKPIKKILSVPDEEILFCGMAIGYADINAKLANFHSERAPLSEIATFHGFTNPLSSPKL